MQNKNTLLIISILIIVAIFFVLINNKSNTDSSQISEETSVALDTPSTEVPEDVPAIETVLYELTDGTYTFDTQKSKLSWTGKRPLIQGYFDNGVVALKEGTVEVKDSKVTTGNLVIDLATIQAVKSGKDSGEDMLTKHLKSPDFFDIEKFPTATFVVKSVEDLGDGNFKVTGDLTVKDFTETVQADVRATQNADMSVSVKGKLSLDRTKFGLKYQSGQFFKDLGEKIIDDNFDLELELVAAPSK